MSKQDNNSDLMTRAQAASYLKTTTATLAWYASKEYRRLHEGEQKNVVELPYYKVGNKCLYRKSELDSWLESQKVGVGDAE